MDSNKDHDKKAFLEEKKEYHKEASAEYKKAFQHTHNPVYINSSMYHADKSTEDLS